jgi:hypothetical protein
MTWPCIGEQFPILADPEQFEHVLTPLSLVVAFCHCCCVLPADGLQFSLLLFLLDLPEKEVR